MGNMGNAVYLSGIKGDDFYTVSCLRMNNIEINLTQGKCAKELEKAFDIQIEVGD